VALSAKKQVVLETYLSNPAFTLEDAVRKVGGVSEKRIPITACELSHDEEFAKAMARRTEQKLEALERKDDKLTPQAVLDSLTEIDAECKAAGDVAWAIQGRLKVVELRGKHLGMFADKVELAFGDELAKALAEARERRKLAELPAIEGALADN
jgi:hypothetical protein